MLVLGGGGMLGRAVQVALRGRGTPFQAPPRSDADLLRPESLEAGIATHATVINCAAWTDVDGAEAAEAAATQLNGQAVGALGALCRKHGSFLVHYSTDYVFDGRGTSPYPIPTAHNPMNAYGRSKALGERLLADEVSRGLNALVLRTSWLYAPWGKNFVRTIAGAARQRPVLRVVNDQRGRPTSCEVLAQTTLRLLDAGASGVMHAADGGEATWFDFATRIAAFASKTCRVEPCSSSEYPRPACRPAYSVLDLSRTEQLLGPLPAWTSSLDSVLSRLEL